MISMREKHEPNVISLSRDASPSLLPWVGMFALFVVCALLLEHAFYLTTGTAKTTTTTVEHDGHRLILSTTMFGVSAIHHPDCACQVRAER